MATFGCTLTRRGEIRYHLPYAAPDRIVCIERDTTWASAMDNQPIDVAVLQFGPWEVADHRMGRKDVWRAPGDKIYDTYLGDEVTTAT